MSGVARALYFDAGVVKQIGELGSSTRKDQLQVDSLQAITAAGAAVVNLFTTLGTGDTINIGSGGSGGATVDIGGDLEVSGDEVVVGDTVFEGDTQIGNEATDVVTFVAVVGDNTNPDLTFNTEVAAQKITTNNSAYGLTVEAAGNNLVLQTTTSGNVSILPASGSNAIITAAGAGVVDIDGAAGINIGSSSGGAVVIASDTNSSFNVTTGNLSLGTTTSGDLILSTTTAGDIKIDASAAGSILIGAGTARPVDLNTTTLDIDSTGLVSVDSSENITLTSTKAAGGIGLYGENVQIVASAGDVSLESSNNVVIRSEATNLVTQLTSGYGGTPYTAKLFVGSGSPSSISANAGDFYFDTSTSGGAPYYCTGGTTWIRVGSATGYSSLQQAYDTGQTIQLEGTSKGDMIIETDESDTVADFIVRDETGTSNYLATDATNNQLELGSSAMTVGFIGKVDTDITLETSVGAKQITGDGSNALTITNTGAGALTLTSPTTAIWSTSSGGLTVQGASTLGLTAGTGAVTLTASSGSVIVNSVGLDVNAGAGSISLEGTGTSNFKATSGELTIQTATSGNINLTAADSAFITLRTNGATGPIVDLHTRATDPDGALSGAYGDVCLVNDSIDYGIYICANGTTWVKVATGDVVETLQEAYNNSSAPATIEMVTNKNLIFETFYDVSTPSNFVVRHEGGGDNYIATTTTSATAGVLQLGSTNVAVNSLNTLQFTGTNRIVKSDTGNLTVQTTTSGDLTLSAAGTAYLDGTTAINIGTVADHPVTIEASTLDVNTSDAVTIDAASNGISLGAAGASDFSVSTGGLTLQTTSSGGINIDSVGSVNIEADSSSTWNVTGGSLNITTTTSGAIQIAPASTEDLILTTSGAGGVLDINTGAGGIDIDSTGGIIAIDSTTSVNVTGGFDSQFTTSSGTLLVRGAGALTLSSTGAGVIVTAAANNNVAVSTTGTGDVTLSVANDAAAEVSFTAHGQTLTLNSDTYKSFASTNYLVGDTSIVEALIDLDAAIATNSVYVQAGENLALGDAVYLNTSDNKAYKTDANDNTKVIFIGFARAAITAPAFGYVVVAGEAVVSTDLSAIGENAPNGTVLFLSGTTGGVTKTAPSVGGDTVLKVAIVTDQANDKVAIQVGTPFEL